MMRTTKGCTDKLDQGRDNGSREKKATGNSVDRFVVNYVQRQSAGEKGQKRKTHFVILFYLIL
jgi:hypothetical protein